MCQHRLGHNQLRKVLRDEEGQHSGKKLHTGLNPAGWGSRYSPFLGSATPGAPTQKGWTETGRAELRDTEVLQGLSTSCAKVWGAALVSFGKEEAKEYLITAATSQKVLTDRNKTLLLRDTCYITRSNTQFTA